MLLISGQLHTTSFFLASSDCKEHSLEDDTSTLSTLIHTRPCASMTLVWEALCTGVIALRWNHLFDRVLNSERGLGGHYLLFENLTPITISRVLVGVDLPVLVIVLSVGPLYR